MGSYQLNNGGSGSTTVTNLTAQWSDLMKSLEQDAGLAELWLRGMHDWASLDTVAKLRFGAFGGRFLANSEGLFLYRSDLGLDPRLWRGVERRVADVVAHPGFQSWWETRRHWYCDAFQQFIDRLIGEQTAPSLYRDYGPS